MNLLDEAVTLILSECSGLDLIHASQVNRQLQKCANEIARNVHGAKDVYHSYYLYSLNYLTRHTPLDKRCFAHIARKTCKAGRLSLEDLEYFEQKYSSSEDIKVKYTLLEMRRRLLRLEKDTGRVFDSRDPENPKIFLCEEWYFLRTNFHRGVELEARYGEIHPSLLFYSSDARMTALVLAASRDIEKDLTGLTMTAVRFVWVDNAESLEVILKYMKSRIEEKIYNGILAVATYFTAFRDAVKCYLLLRKIFKEDMTIMMEIIACLCNSIGITGYSSAELNFLGRMLKPLVGYLNSKIKSPF